MAKVISPSKRMLASQRNGRLGGLATARKYGSEFCIERATNAGLRHKAIYGSEFYAFIRNYPRHPRPGYKQAAAGIKAAVDRVMSMEVGEQCKRK